MTQRGSRRQDVFFNDEDREVYYDLYRKYSAQHGLDPLSHCLMTNHVHHLVVPHELESLSRAFQQTHKRYADYINARHGWSGHLWQQRFYSSPVDEKFLWIAIRYIERNPVAACMVKHAADYRWSSAPSRCNGIADPVLTKNPRWLELMHGMRNWYEWLSQSDDPLQVKKLREQTRRDLPTGSEHFLDSLEERYSVRVRLGKRGKRKKE